MVPSEFTRLICFSPTWARGSSMRRQARALDNAVQVSIEPQNLRRRFEKALLALLTSPNAPADTAGVADLHDILVDIEHAQNTPQARDFWWVMHGFIDSVIASKEPLSLFVKQVCGRMNRQIKLLAQGSSSTSDRFAHGYVVLRGARGKSFALFQRNP